MGDILVIFVLGVLCGFIARALHPGKDEMGITASAILGLSGAIIAQLGIPIGLYKKGDIISYIVSILISTLILFIYGIFSNKNKLSNTANNSGNIIPNSNTSSVNEQIPTQNINNNN
jgi:uncharacterized membrane protein YeaQ/YmgE (transglycosylase-associated protein family)